MRLSLLCGHFFACAVTAAAASATAASATIPVLTFENMQSPGDSSTTLSLDTNTISTTGDSGAGVAWDYSSIQGGAIATERYGIAPSQTPFALLYPTATHCERTVQTQSQVDNYQYYSVTASQAAIIGASGGVIDSTRYNDPDVVLKFPFTFRDTNIDTADVVQYVHDGSKILTSQRRITVADGYGTLKLPTGNFSEVLRYKAVIDQNIKIVIGNSVASTLSYHIVQYLWADAGYHDFLLEYHPVLLKNGVQQRRSGTYWTDPKPLFVTTAIRLTGGEHRVRAGRTFSPVGNVWMFSKLGFQGAGSRYESSVRLKNALGRSLPESSFPR